MFEQTASVRGHFPHQRTVMERTFVKQINQAPLETQPFDHVYLQDLFSAPVYQQMLMNFPAPECFHSLLHPDAMRSDGSSTRMRFYLYPEQLRKLPNAQRAVWLPLARMLVSRQLQDAFKHKFRRALEARFGRGVDQLSFYPVPILVRDLPGYRIGIHSDVMSKAITVQFYLPEDHRQIQLGTIFHRSRDSDAGGTRKMAFLPASGYAFPVQQSASWHSAEATTSADGERRSIMLTYYVQGGVKSWLRRRLYRLRSSFGIHPQT